MMLDAVQLEEGLDLFLRLLAGDAVLQAELAVSEREFFRGAPGDQPAAVRRHLEWFLFERLSGPRHELAIERLLPAWREAAGEELVEGVDTFLTSCSGIFRVGRVEPGRGAWLGDLAGLGEYPVEEARASKHFEEGDLVVGRLFAVGDGIYRISPAAQLFRNEELALAIERDLERLREERHHAVMRVGQIELETMFFGAGGVWTPSGVDRATGVMGPGGGAAPIDPVGEARTLLNEGGVAPAKIEAILRTLSLAPFDPTALVHGIGDPLADVLELLAFESRVDLARARVLLLAAWAHMWRPEETPPASPAVADAKTKTKTSTRSARDEEEDPPSDSVRAALERFTESRRAGVDLEGCFDELERDLGLSGEGEEDGAEELPDFPGVVAAMIEEFVWERSLQGAPAEAPEYDILRRLGGFTEQVGVIENLEPTQVLGFAALWLPDRVEFEDGESAARAVRALREFVDWLAREHAIELGEETAETLEELERELPRVAEVNRRLSSEPRAAGKVEAESWFEVEERADSGAPCLKGPGGLLAEVPLEAEVATLLEPGDWLRFELDAGGRSRPARCFPAQASSWLAGRKTSGS